MPRTRLQLVCVSPSLENCARHHSGTASSYWCGRALRGRAAPVGCGHDGASPTTKLPRACMRCGAVVRASSGSNSASGARVCQARTAVSLSSNFDSSLVRECSPENGWRRSRSLFHLAGTSDLGQPDCFGRCRRFCLLHAACAHFMNVGFASR